MHLNETKTIGDYEFTITDVRITDKFVVKSADGTGRQFGTTGTDNCQIVVLYTLKNIGKSEIKALKNSLTVEYSQGYTFESNLYYHNTVNSDIFTYGGTQESFVNLKVLGNEIYFLEAFTVPATVRDNTDEPLKLIIKGKSYGVEGQDIIYNIRPVDDTQKKALYQQAVSLKNEGNYKLAMDKLNEIGEYKDSKNIYDECQKNWAVHYGVTDDAKEYFLNNMDKFSAVSGSELTSVMVGRWQLSKGSTPWYFLNDGTIDDGFGNTRSWSVNGDNLILKTNKITDTLTVKKVCENGYLLLDNNGELYATMYLAD